MGVWYIKSSRYIFVTNSNPKSAESTNRAVLTFTRRRRAVVIDRRRRVHVLANIIEMKAIILDRIRNCIILGWGGGDGRWEGTR
jgi:hypothetical protein